MDQAMPPTRRGKSWPPAARRVTIFTSQHCPACRRVSAELIAVCRRGGLEPEVLDVIAHLEAAAQFGVSQPPAVVINGRLLAQGARAPHRLRGVLTP